ncbi:hypothetical protein QUC31_002039, partial [Theobroma cacao]
MSLYSKPSFTGFLSVGSETFLNLVAISQQVYSGQAHKIWLKKLSGYQFLNLNLFTTFFSPLLRISRISEPVKT